jgi:hypothetical protein
MTQLSILLCLILGNRGDVRPVERIEINHVYEQDGRVRFVQAIVWEWQHDYRRFAVRNWRMIDDGEVMRTGKLWVMRWGDQRISSQFTSVTHTYEDREFEDRRLTPMQDRNLIK